MRSVDSNFYRSKEWIRCKEAYLNKVNHLCERCLAKGLIVPARIVHHREHLNEFNIQDAAVALNFDNLEALCQDCHNKEHFGNNEKRRWKINESGGLSFESPLG